jgi:hypothetical protein
MKKNTINRFFRKRLVFHNFLCILYLNYIYYKIDLKNYLLYYVDFNRSLIFGEPGRRGGNRWLANVSPSTSMLVTNTYGQQLHSVFASLIRQCVDGQRIS